MSDKQQAGTMVKFTYAPSVTLLSTSDEIICESFAFYSTAYPKNYKIPLIRKGNLLYGEYLSQDSISLLALTFHSGKKSDEPQNGYFQKFHQSGKIKSQAELAIARIYEKLGPRYLGIKTDLTKATQYYKKAFILEPKLSEKLSLDYLSVAYRTGLPQYKAIVDNKILELSRDHSAEESKFVLLYKLYQLKQQKKRCDSLEHLILNQFPLGDFAFYAAFKTIKTEMPLKQNEESADFIFTKFELGNDNEMAKRRKVAFDQYMVWIYSKNDNYKKSAVYARQQKGNFARASWLNLCAERMLEKNADIDFALSLSAEAVQLTQMALKESVPYNYTSQQEYDDLLNSNLGNCMNTYAALLYTKGDFSQALNQQRIVVRLAPSSDASERLVSYLKATGNLEEALSVSEQLIKSGYSSESLIKDFKSIYSALQRNDDFDNYLTKIKITGDANELADYKKNMVSYPAPPFELLNLDGQKVDLAKLRGKIVVLDFWATWCAPCIASFPGMQKIVHEKKQDTNIVFLFINTLQPEDNRGLLVSDLVIKRKLDFNILMDTKNSNDNLKFDTASSYNVTGIPAKFIIDKSGNVRFKLVGSSSDVNVIVKELNTMIKLIDD
jgi:thiol-disulfide isomerase/thioredoxin